MLGMFMVFLGECGVKLILSLSLLWEKMLISIDNCVFVILTVVIIHFLITKVYIFKLPLNITPQHCNSKPVHIFIPQISFQMSTRLLIFANFTDYFFREKLGNVQELAK